jgi:hypothetical protein
MRARRVIQAKLPRTEVNMYPVTAFVPRRRLSSVLTPRSTPRALLPIRNARERWLIQISFAVDDLDERLELKELSYLFRIRNSTCYPLRHNISH